MMGLEKKVMTEQEKENRRLLKLIEKSGLNEKELKLVLKRTHKEPKGRVVDIPKKRIVYGVISDSHIGSVYYDSQTMDHAAREFNKRKVDFVMHGGDLCEGHYEGRRAGSVFELDTIGGDAQVKKAQKELQKINKKIPIYLITGNHEYNTFYRNGGFEIGQRMEELLPNLTYLGNGEGTINLPNGNKILTLHPDGGSSYAISYKSQKIAESLDGGSKPNILHIAHFHKSEYLFYRNIHIIQNGCLQKQSKFMKGKHLSAHRGFWIVEADTSKKGILRIKPEWFPTY